jgi:dTDP-4-amino-4,6-dideoxy-D-glucose acyltransferase
VAWLNAQQIADMGFMSVGEGALLSDRASFHNCAQIRIGRHSRIDDFVVLSAGDGGIDIGVHVHVAVYAALIGKGRIHLEDFCNVSSRVSIYSSNDDYSGQHMTNPTVPAAYTGVTHAAVRIGRHAIIGSGSVVLPGVTVGEGAAVGALSLVRGDCDSFTIYVGTPARSIGHRQRALLDLEAQFSIANQSS